jgi:penicillin-binding protein 1C
VNGNRCVFLRGLDPVASPTEQGQADADTRRVFDADAAWLIGDILSDERARALAFGLNSPLNLPFRVAAKTGTSTDFRDSWTIGYTPDFTVGVWVGRFDNRPLNRVSGAMGRGPRFSIR